MDKNTLEYYDTKLQLYLHAYDEGERNIQEFKRSTLNGLRNIGMLQHCWNVLSKRTEDWGEIRMTIEDQITVQRNWNLHPNNPNPDMTGLKNAYKSKEENYLGKTGQIRMEVNQVQNAPVFYPAPNQTPNMPVTLARECEDTLNHLGNFYGCNKPGHLKRNCPEGNSTQTQARSSDNRGQRKEVICFCDKAGDFARQCRGPKKNYKRDNTQEDKMIMKLVQKMLVRSNSKLEDFP